MPPQDNWEGIENVERTSLLSSSPDSREREDEVCMEDKDSWALQDTLMTVITAKAEMSTLRPMKIAYYDGNPVASKDVPGYLILVVLAAP